MSFSTIVGYFEAVDLDAYGIAFVLLKGRTIPINLKPLECPSQLYSKWSTIFYTIVNLVVSDRSNISWQKQIFTWTPIPSTTPCGKTYNLQVNSFVLPMYSGNVSSYKSNLFVRASNYFSNLVATRTRFQINRIMHTNALLSDIDCLHLKPKLPL